MPLASAPCSHSCLAAIPWFDPAPRTFFHPDRNAPSRRAQDLSRLAASPRTPEGLGLDRPEHAGMLDRIGYGGRWYLPQSRDAALTRPCRPCAPKNPPKNIGLRNVGTLSPKGNSNRWNSMKSTPLVTLQGVSSRLSGQADGLLCGGAGIAIGAISARSQFRSQNRDTTCRSRPRFIGCS
jgi:hypothetical protein